MDYKKLKLKNVIAELFRLYHWPSLVWWVMSGYIEVTCHEYIIIGVWKLQPLINTNWTRLMKACKVIQPKYFSCKIYYILVKSFQMIYWYMTSLPLYYFVTVIMNSSLPYIFIFIMITLFIFIIIININYIFLLIRSFCLILFFPFL